MRFLKSAKPALLVALLVALTVSVVPVFAAPLHQNNLLSNPDFEGAFSTTAYTNTPDGWTAWWQDDDTFDRPTFNASEGAPDRLKSGVRAASYWSQFTRYNAGLWQRVNAANGTVYRFTAWGQSVCKVPSGANPALARMQIGIDPTGGDNPFSGNIVWSGVLNPMGSYQQFTVETAAKSDKISVFLRASNDWPVDQCDSYWDATGLTAVGQASAPTGAPTSAPSGSTTGGSSTGGSSCNVPIGSIPKATPQPDGSIIHTVQRCETLYGLEVTYGIPIAEIRSLNNLTEGSVIHPGDQLLIQGPTQQAQPTAAPATQEPQPTQEATQVAETDGDQPPVEEEPVATTGTICVRSYNDVNANGLREPEEPMQAGVTFAVSDGANTVGTYTTSDSPEAYCFTELAAGTYTVSWVADNYTPTTDQTWVANISGGSTATHEFGIAAGDLPAMEGEEGASSGGGLPRIVTAVIGAVGVIFFLAGLGAAAYFLVLRRNVASS